jgi:hypothetical protein
MRIRNRHTFYIFTYACLYIYIYIYIYMHVHTFLTRIHVTHSNMKYSYIHKYIHIHCSDANPAGAPILYIPFVIFFCYIALNTVIAVIVEAYQVCIHHNRLSVCLPVSGCLSVCLYFCMRVSLSVCLSVFM